MNCSNFHTHGGEYLGQCVKYCSFVYYKYYNHYNQVQNPNQYTYYLRDILIIKQYVSLSKYVIIMNRNCEHDNQEWSTLGKCECSLH